MVEPEPEEVPDPEPVEPEPVEPEPVPEPTPAPEAVDFEPNVTLYAAVIGGIVVLLIVILVVGLLSRKKARRAHKKRIQLKSGVDDSQELQDQKDIELQPLQQSDPEDKARRQQIERTMQAKID